MTAPQGEPPPQQEPAPTEVPVEAAAVEEDAASLVPALLAIIAAYLAWKAGGKVLTGGWERTAVTLRISSRAGVILGRIAERALERQRTAAGAAGDQLWEHLTEAVEAGQDAGIRVIAEAIEWMDRHTTPAVPADQATATIPTAEDPPTDLAQMSALATKNAATFAAAEAAGWKRKTWNDVGDDRVRGQHQILGDPTWRFHTVPLADLFEQPDGAVLRYPGDPLAPIGARIHCRCWATYERNGLRRLIDRVTG